VVNDPEKAFRLGGKKKEERTRFAAFPETEIVVNPSSRTISKNVANARGTGRSLILHT
jgi:hypothetical protein